MLRTNREWAVAVTRDRGIDPSANAAGVAAARRTAKAAVRAAEAVVVVVVNMLRADTAGDTVEAAGDIAGRDRSKTKAAAASAAWGPECPAAARFRTTVWLPRVR
jgi:hypothetical protein